MTIREQLNTRKKRVVTALLGSALLATASAFVSVRYEVVFLLTLVCVLLAIVVMYLAVLLGFRCPRCRGQWGYLAMYSGGVFSIREDLSYCPYCGAEIDQEDGVDSLRPRPGSPQPDA